MKKRFIQKVLEIDPKCVDALVASLAFLTPGQVFLCNTGKITKLDESTFSITVDADVIKKGMDGLYNELLNSDPIDRIFE